MDAVVSFMQAKPFLIVMLVIWAISAVGLVILVLLHSGKGTGVSEVIAGSIYGGDGGSSIVERNLDRITVIFAIIFLVTLLILMVSYPHGAVS